MNKQVIFMSLVLPFIVAAGVGCTDGGAIAFRHQEPGDVASIVAHPETTSDSDVHPAATSDTNDTLVSTVSARRPRQPSLITLAAGDDLVAKVNSANGPVLLDFYADWCGPCKVQGRILHDMEEVAARQGALMIKINIDDHPAIARELQVQGVPTLVMVKNGRIVNRQSGVADKDRLLSWMK